jgi:hypothetical protein
MEQALEAQNAALDKAQRRLFVVSLKVARCAALDLKLWKIIFMIRHQSVV